MWRLDAHEKRGDEVEGSRHQCWRKVHRSAETTEASDDAGVQNTTGRLGSGVGLSFGRLWVPDGCSSREQTMMRGVKNIGKNEDLDALIAAHWKAFVQRITELT